MTVTAEVHVVCPDSLYTEGSLHTGSCVSLPLSARTSEFDRLHRPMREGEIMYVVSTEWLHRFQDESWDSFEAVDNSRIVSVDESLAERPCRLSAAAVEPFDYVLVNEEQYDWIMKKCGGGPHVPRPVVKDTTTGSGNLTVEVHPWKITLQLSASSTASMQDEKHVLFASKKWPLRQIKSFCRIPMYVRLSVAGKVAILDDQKSLEELELFDGALLERGSDFAVLNGTGVSEGATAADEDSLIPSPSSSVASMHSNSSSDEFDHGSTYPAGGRSTSTSKSGYPHNSLSSGGNSSNSCNSMWLSRGHGNAREGQHSYLDEKRAKPAPMDGAGLCGLSNLGNTCFMNSGLQCLMHTVPLKEYFSDYERWTKEVNRDNALGSGGYIADQFGRLIREVWSGSPNSVVTPREFKFTLGRFAPQFSGYAQHDSQELLAFLLDGLHEDLNRVKQKPYTDLSNVKSAEEAWALHKARNDSVIVDLFQGQLKSTLVCPSCSLVSVTWDPFMYLSLPLPNESQIPVHVRLWDMSGTDVSVRDMIVSITRGRSVKFLLDLVRTQADIPVDHFMVLAESWHDRIHRIIESSKTIESSHVVREVQNVYVFSEAPENGYYFVSIRRRERSYGSSRNVSHELGLPFVIPKDDRVTEHITSVLRFFLDATQLAQSSKRVASQMDIDAQDAEPSAAVETREDDTEHATDQADGESPFTIVPEDPLYTYGEKNKYQVIFEDRDFDIRKLEDKVVEDPSIHKYKADRESGCSIASCLDMFVKQEILGDNDQWYCPKCKAHVHASKKFDLARLPEVLVIHLKRFSYSSLFRSKLETTINFPVEGLDVSPYLDSAAHGVTDASDTVYDLFATSNHFGSLSGGHYTASALSGKDENVSWYKFDDSWVAAANQRDLDSPSAYVLFYRRRHRSSHD
eukprot:ANDGO_06591.mRNA.1 Putative ubiquitin carboxyl-terminal hydrolase 11